MSGSSVTRPITATGRSQRRQTASTAGHWAGSTIATMRSCDSEIITSNGSRPGSRRGIASRSTSIPVPPRSAVSQVAQVMPAAPRSWTPTTRPFEISSSVASISSFSANGSPTWTDGRLDGSWSPKVADASTDAPPMPSRPVAEPYRTTRLPDAVGRRPGEHPVLEQPDGHDVDQRVALVRGVEHELAAHRRHADAVAVPADAAHDAVDEVPRPRVGRVAEPERVEDRDRPRAHREHVAQDPADAGRRALVRLDGRRVVVGLDLERDREPVADRDHAGLLPHPGDDVAAGGRERREQRPGALVRAVLAPHDAEHRELEVVGIAAQLLADRLELDVLEPEGAVQRGGGGRRHPATPDSSAAAGRPRGARDRARRRPLGRAHHQRADDAQAVVGAEQRLGGRLGVRHEARHVAGGVAHARDPAQRAVGVARVVGPGHGAVGVRVAPQHAARRARARRGPRRRRSSSPRRGRPASGAATPSSSRVNGVSRCSGSSVTSRHTKRRARFRSSAPGTSPASASTWKPLQIPSTGPPRSANAATALHDRAEPRDDAGAQVVAVREAAGQQDAVHAVEIRRLVPQDHRLRAGERDGVDRVDVAVGAREQDDADAGRHPAAPAVAVVAPAASPSDSTS